MRNSPFTSPDAASADADANGSAMFAGNTTRISGDVTIAGVSGTVAGTAKFQQSNADAGGVLPGYFEPPEASWQDIPNASIAIADNGVYAIPATDVAFQWIRAKFVYSSGAGGTVTIRSNLIGWS